jgi:hypothetical protein
MARNSLPCEKLSNINQQKKIVRSVLFNRNNNSTRVIFAKLAAAQNVKPINEKSSTN